MVEQSNAILTFCCYARKDKDLLNELKIHLSVLQRKMVIDVWHDGDISAGTEWDREIKMHLNQAEIILLLISPDFIHSEYCYGTEMQHALERHKQGNARVIPILLRPTSDWRNVPSGDIQLGQLQALPRDVRPVKSWKDRDKVWKGVVEEIESVANELLRKSSMTQSTPVSDLGANIPAIVPANPPSIESHPPISRRAVIIGLGALAAVSVAGGRYVYSMVMSTYNAQAMVTPSVTPTTYDDYVSQHGIMFGFDEQHTRNNRYEQIINVANVSQLRQKWVSDPTGGYIASSPAMANGVVYVGSWDGMLYAFDAATGGKKWVSALTEGYIESSPAVANGVVYIVSDDHKLHAFDAATGKQKWAPALTADFKTQDQVTFIRSSPAVANEVVYVGSLDRNLYAFDATTGGLKWVSAPTGGYINSSPAVANGVVYVGSDDGMLYAFDATTGGKKWVSDPTGGYIESSPAVANGVVYVGSDDGMLYAFDATTGGLKWVSAPTGGYIYSSPVVANGVVYVGSDRKLYAFDATTGKQKWASALMGGLIYSSPAVANGVVYVGSAKDHSLYAFSLA